MLFILESTERQRRNRARLLFHQFAFLEDVHHQMDGVVGEKEMFITRFMSLVLGSPFVVWPFHRLLRTLFGSKSKLGGSNTEHSKSPPAAITQGVKRHLLN